MTFAPDNVVKKVHDVNGELLFVDVSQIDLTFHLYVDDEFSPERLRMYRSSIEGARGKVTN